MPTVREPITPSELVQHRATMESEGGITLELARRLMDEILRLQPKQNPDYRRADVQELADEMGLEYVYPDDSQHSMHEIRIPGREWSMADPCIVNLEERMESALWYWQCRQDLIGTSS